jgi:hypothetical protein
MSRKNTHAVALGERGGIVMSPARLAHNRRIASLGVAARWRTKQELRALRKELAGTVALDQARAALDRLVALGTQPELAHLAHRAAKARLLLNEEGS